ncbi:cupin domain-containing protein [Haloferax sp. MBLA0076]|uniref:Cupin domain-containing protein n=1 Tax=Haloferax litoreum TaxID=2666140 RepID=A0A6A8GKZ6_9EURY|nr:MULTISPECIES: cupin domain-containing protein [Haloferax]KAB1194861.1 cupin domain-containing protein [Haloferax sp. CBA1148]MRX22757.1 cupin domain-containing protein [Haloferax litoreum]
MSYTKANYREVDELGGGLHFMRDVLETERLGFTVLECDPNWTGKAHDHAEEDHEEVYFLVSGDATLVVEGEKIPLETGDAVRVSPEDTRQFRNGDTESFVVVAGSP